MKGKKLYNTCATFIRTVRDTGRGLTKKIEIDQLYCTADRMCIKHYQERYLIYHNINTLHGKTKGSVYFITAR